MAEKTLAFDVERVRAALLADMKIPPELVNRTLKKISDKLDAKRTEFFAFQGQVIEKVDVEDHKAQQKAVDQVLEISGLKAREGEKRQATPSVAVEVDARTGVVRLVMGTPQVRNDVQVLPAGEPQLALSTAPAVEQGSVAPSPSSEGALPPSGGTADEPDAEPQIITVRRKPGTIDEATRKILFD